MGDVLDPKPPQWERRHALENVAEDLTLQLAARFMQMLTEELDSTVVQLAALRLVQKAIIGNYQLCMGETDTKEVLAQATALAAQYIVRGSDGVTEF